MRQTTPRLRAHHDVPSKSEQRLTDAQQSKMYRFQTVVGVGIVGLSVLAGIGLCISGQLPLPAAIGLVLLAVFRLYALKQELKRQKTEQA